MRLRQIIVWSGAFSAASALVKAAYVGLIIVLAAMLPPGLYANFGLLYAAQTAMGTFAGVGAQEVTIGRLKGYATEIRRDLLFRKAVALFYVTTVLAFVSIGIVVLVSVPESIALKTTSLALLLGAINAFALLQSALLRIDERYAASLTYSAGVPLFSCAGSAMGLMLSRSIDAVFLGGVLGGAFAIGILGLQRRGYAGGSPCRYALWSDIRSLAPFAVMAVFGWMGGYGITFVVNAIFDSVDVAQYTFLLTVSAVAQMVATATNMVWSPRFYRLFLEATPGSAEQQSHRFFRLQAMCLGGLGALVVGALPWVAVSVGGHLTAYGSMQLELALLFAGCVAVVPWWHTQNYYLVTNQGARLMRIVIWTGVGGLVVWIVCMLAFGPLGIYIGFVIQAAFKSVGAWLGARKEWGVSPPWAAIGSALAVTFMGMVIPGPSELF